MFAARNVMFTAGVAKKSYSYTFSGTTKPAAIIDIAINTGAGATTVSGGVIREGNSTAKDGTYHTASIWGVRMGTSYYRSIVTSGNLNSTNRLIGVGMSDATGQNIVYCVVPSQNAGYTSAIITRIAGGARMNRSTSTSTYVNGTQTVALVPTISAGIYTYTVYVNNVAKFSWTDNNSAFGTPGKYPCGIFGHIYSSAQYVSPGISAYAAADI